MTDRIDSTSDERTKNNVMRHEYRVLSDSEKAQMQAVKDKGLELVELIRALPRVDDLNLRELEIAEVRATEAIMWAVRYITAPKKEAAHE